MNGGDGGSDRPQGLARRTASPAPRTVAFGPQPVRRFTGPAHLRLCPHWLRLPPTAPTVATKKQARGLFCMSMVEMVGVEPTSESISAGISPSAVNVL